MRRVVIWLLFCCIALKVNGQNQREKRLGQQIDSSYIKPNLLNSFAGYIISVPQLSVRLNPQQASNITAHSAPDASVYWPNQHSMFGVYAGYRNLTFDLLFRTPAARYNENKYGQSRYFNIGANVMKKTYAVKFQLHYNRGFFDRKTKDYLPNWRTGDPMLTRPDIRYFELSASYMHIFNPQKYSYRGAHKFMERQMKSAGSVLLTNRIGFNRVAADSALVPGFANGYFNAKQAALKRFFILKYAFMPGYGYTYVFRRNEFFVSGSACVGPELQYQNRYYEAFSNENVVRIAPAVMAALTLGYNNPDGRFYAGVSGSADYVFFNFDGLSGNVFNGTGRFYMGWRFNSPRFFDIFINNIIKKINALGVRINLE